MTAAARAGNGEGAGDLSPIGQVDQGPLSVAGVAGVLGGVEVDQARMTDSKMGLSRGKNYLLRVGSKNRRFAYVTVKA